MLAMRLEEQHAIWTEATAPGHVENAFKRVFLLALAGAATILLAGFLHQGLQYPLTAVMFLAIALVWLSLWRVKHRARTAVNNTMLNPIAAGRPDSVRMVLFLFRPVFQPLVFDNGEVIEVTLDPFILNAVERDYDFEERLNDADVTYERVDGYTAHLTRQTVPRPLGAA